MLKAEVFWPYQMDVTKGNKSVCFREVIFGLGKRFTIRIVGQSPHTADAVKPNRATSIPLAYYTAVYLIFKTNHGYYVRSTPTPHNTTALTRPPDYGCRSKELANLTKRHCQSLLWVTKAPALPFHQKNQSPVCGELCWATWKSASRKSPSKAYARTRPVGRTRVERSQSAGT